MLKVKSAEAADPKTCFHRAEWLQEEEEASSEEVAGHREGEAGVILLVTSRVSPAPLCRSHLHIPITSTMSFAGSSARSWLLGGHA